MFERYTEKARRSIFFARYEASQLGSPDINSEHLLLGLLRDDKAVVRQLLLKLDYESVRDDVAARVQAPGGPKLPPSVVAIWSFNEGCVVSPAVSHSKLPPSVYRDDSQKLSPEERAIPM